MGILRAWGNYYSSGGDGPRPRYLCFRTIVAARPINSVSPLRFVASILNLVRTTGSPIEEVSVKVVLSVFNAHVPASRTSSSSGSHFVLLATEYFPSAVNTVDSSSSHVAN